MNIHWILDVNDHGNLDSSDTKTASSDDVINCTDSSVKEAAENIASTWHSCSICLEEKFDEELRVHPICGGLLCKECLGRTVEYSEGKSFPCPVSVILRSWGSSTNFASNVNPLVPDVH